MLRRVVQFAILAAALAIGAGACGGANKGVEKPANPAPPPKDKPVET